MIGDFWSLFESVAIVDGLANASFVSSIIHSLHFLHNGTCDFGAPSNISQLMN